MMYILNSFLMLLTVHFIFDWAFQSRWIAENKGKYWEVMFAHCMIYTGGIMLALYILYDVNNIFISLMVLISHYMIDTWKAKKDLLGTMERSDLWVDHLCHFMILLGIVIFNYFS